MNKKNNFRLIQLFVIAILIVIGFGTVSCTDHAAKQEELYQERVTDAVNLYKKLCQAISIIKENNDIYVSTTTAQIDDGIFSEDKDAAIYEKMFATIDANLKKLNIRELCDSLSVKSLKESDDYNSWPSEIKDKAGKIESIISDLCSVGYKIGGFNERNVAWNDEPWASANSPYYHDLPNIPKYIESIDKIGENIETLKPGTYSKLSGNSIGAKKMENDAIAYYYGNGVPKDMKTAKELFISAAQHGEAHSMYCLGIITEDTDAKVAEKWYLKAAVAGSTKAMIELAKTYYDPLNRSHQNKSKDSRYNAKKWYKRAANFANPDGVYNMALNYYMGWYDEINKDIADKFCTIGICLQSAQCANLKGALQNSKEEQAKYYKVALKFDPDYKPAKMNLRDLGYDM